MYSRFLIFFWRRKLFFCGSSVAFLLILWLWGFLYSSHYTDDDGKIMSIRELMPGGKHEGLLQRLGFHDFNANANQAPHAAAVKFLKATGHSINSQTREKLVGDWDSILMNKEEKTRIQNLDVPSRDDIARRRTAAEEKKKATGKLDQYEHDLKRMGIPVLAGLGPDSRPPKQRLVHIDLKGAPPKISYLKRLMPIFKTLGATGLLLEYEDMFPYTGMLSQLAAKNAYTRAELLELLQTAFSLGLTVMPLVQTFGHLEFTLKLKEFEYLREVPESPQALCPSLNSSLIFIEEMLAQVIELHTMPNNDVFVKSDVDKLIPKLVNVHIGCDEVYHMAECSRCRDKIKDQLFLDHVYNVAEIIKKRWPSLKIIIWDDMLRHMSLETLENSRIGNYIEGPMVWVYAEEIYKFIQAPLWDKYASVFKTAWTASAFKGAHGEALIIPPAKRHLENTLRWLLVMETEGKRFSQGLQGIVLTGWQRYDHFAILCELLPPALPSLAICLSTASKGYFETDSKKNPVLTSLTCPEHDHQHWIDLQKDPNMSGFSRCMFPGSPVFRFIQRLSRITKEANEYIDQVKHQRGWLTDYNIRHNFSSVLRVSGILDEESRILMSVTNLAKSAVDAMYDVYDHWTIGEYIEQKIYGIMSELKYLEKTGESLKMRKTWPQRPLPYLKQLELLGVLPPATQSSLKKKLN